MQLCTHQLYISPFLVCCASYFQFLIIISNRICFKSEKKMTSENPSTISMALMNPQMASSSADSKNSSTQQLSISVWVISKTLHYYDDIVGSWVQEWKYKEY